MRRRISNLALFGLFFGVLTFAGAAHASGGRRGQTYHYNGSAGYWAAPAGYANCAPCHATQTPQYVQRPTAYAPQPAYYAPAPTYMGLATGVYAPARSSWYRR